MILELVREFALERGEVGAADSEGGCRVDECELARFDLRAGDRKEVTDFAYERVKGEISKQVRKVRR